MRPSASVSDIAAWMAALAPPSLAEGWDKVGLQIGDGLKEVRSVMTTLTVTDDVLDQAIRHHIQLIVAHHPLIFQPLVQIDPGTRVGALIVRLIRQKIALYVAHTNLDAAAGGVNDGLVRRLGLKDVLPLQASQLKEPGDHGEAASQDGPSLIGLGRVGRLAAPMEISAFVDQVKKALSVERVRVVGSLNQNVETVAVLGGSGGSFVGTAHQRGADVLVTGDVDFHDADEALSLGLCVIDAGHFGTEKHVSADLAHYLRQMAEAHGVALDVLVADESDPFEFT